MEASTVKLYLVFRGPFSLLNIFGENKGKNVRRRTLSVFCSAYIHKTCKDYHSSSIVCSWDLRLDIASLENKTGPKWSVFSFHLLLFFFLSLPSISPFSFSHRWPFALSSGYECSTLCLYGYYFVVCEESEILIRLIVN